MVSPVLVLYETPMYVISLSSIPSRFAALGPVLEALVAQSARPDRVVLTIPHSYRRFPDYDGALPRVPAGVEILRSAQDFGPASKVLPLVQALKAHGAEVTDILFCDDDLIYEPDWAGRFLAARAQHPDAAICAHGIEMRELGLSHADAPAPRAEKLRSALDFRYRRRKLAAQLRQGKWTLERHEKPSRQRFKRSGHIDVFEGYGGVLVQPRFFDATAYEIPDVLWAVDDFWLSGIVAKNGFAIWCEADATRFRYTPARHSDALNQSVIDGADRHTANVACAKYMRKSYGIWGGA